MALYKLDEYHNNCYHDSYWGDIVYESKSSKISKKETGSTAYASLNLKGYNPKKATKEVILKAEKILSEHIFKVLWETTIAPESIKNETEVKLLKNISFNNKKSGEVINAKKNQKGILFWQKKYSFNGGRKATQVGIKFKDGKVIFTGLYNICHIENKKQIKERSNQLAKNHVWEGMFK